MKKSEDNLTAWLAKHFSFLRDRPGECRPTGPDRDRVEIGIGDDMALLAVGAEEILISTDMLTDGVHFESGIHSPEAIGRKALAVALSDCAAMAVRPSFALVSVALPNDWTMPQAQALFCGMDELAAQYRCAIIGGDTNSWANPLAVDVVVLARPQPGIRPIRRDGARPGDELYVSGKLGGSLLGRHMTFQPRVAEAGRLVKLLGPSVRAMMDLSDGLSTDASRMAAASGCGFLFEETALRQVVSTAAEEAASQDDHTPMDHALNDGEDFELLVAAEPGTMEKILQSQTTESADADAFCKLWSRIGTVIDDRGVWFHATDGSRMEMTPGGWQHFK